MDLINHSENVNKSEQIKQLNREKESILLQIDIIKQLKVTFSFAKCYILVPVHYVVQIGIPTKKCPLPRNRGKLSSSMPLTLGYSPEHDFSLF